MALALLVAVMSTPAIAGWVNACEQEADGPYCADVGKTAHNRGGHEALQEVPLGEIIGVTWRPKGSMVSRPEASTVRIAKRDSWWFIIAEQNNPDYVFLRAAVNIRPR